MGKKVFFIFILSLSIYIIVGCQNNNIWQDDADKVIFYYSDTCPHCRNVEKYIADNNIKTKIFFLEKEVSQNEDNKKSFLDKVEKCKIKPEEAGVPLLWDGSTCIIGDEKIINYFFTKLNEK